MSYTHNTSIRLYSKKENMHLEICSLPLSDCLLILQFFPLLMLDRTFACKYPMFFLFQQVFSLHRICLLRTLRCRCRLLNRNDFFLSLSCCLLCQHLQYTQEDFCLKCVVYQHRSNAAALHAHEENLIGFAI